MVWRDGLEALLGREPSSSLAAEELNSLLDMELRIRLLPLLNVPIPDATPPIPPPPPSLPA